MAEIGVYRCSVRHDRGEGAAMNAPPRDPTFDNFVKAWDALTDEERQRFVDEYSEILVYFDIHERLMPGPNFGLD
jgi:hypothetical protein